MIKIMAVSDMHGRLDGIDPSGCDVCVVAGDFSLQTGFSRSFLLEQRDWIRREFRGWTKSFPGVRFMVVAGNHDLCLDPEVQAKYPDVDWNVEWASNVTYMRDSGVYFGGLVFWGTPWVPIINRRWAFEAERDRLKKKFSLIPDGVDVLVTHGPPRIPGCLCDVSLQYYGDLGERYGSHELAEAVAGKKPKFLFCGHIHSGSHEPFEFEGCVVRNVSRVDERYEVAYDPAFVEAQGRRQL